MCLVRTPRHIISWKRSLEPSYFIVLAHIVPSAGFVLFYLETLFRRGVVNRRTRASKRLVLLEKLFFMPAHAGVAARTTGSGESNVIMGSCGRRGVSESELGRPESEEDFLLLHLFQRLRSRQLDMRDLGGGRRARPRPGGLYNALMCSALASSCVLAVLKRSYTRSLRQHLTNFFSPPLLPGGPEHP